VIPLFEHWLATTYANTGVHVLVPGKAAAPELKAGLLSWENVSGTQRVLAG
jgi:hypothetical protein